MIFIFILNNSTNSDYPLSLLKRCYKLNKMGQTASSRRHAYRSVPIMSKVAHFEKAPKKYRVEIWKQIKDLEVAQLQEKAMETEKEFDKIRKQFLCQSFLLRETFEDQLREQKEIHKKEMQQAWDEIEKSRDEIEKIKKKLET